MTISTKFLVSVALVGAVLAGPAFAQGVVQTISLMKVDATTLATGYRTSKVVGAAIVNETGETVGTIDDLFDTPTDKVPFAVLSVGGFLGVGNKLVVVPASSLEVRDAEMYLGGATKDSLKALPEYKYTKYRRTPVTIANVLAIVTGGLSKGDPP